MPTDFDRSILDVAQHRPWPMPTRRWVMTQTWHDLLFAHWAVAERVLAARLPPGLELDLFDGRAWLGIVPFRMGNVTPRGVPLLPGVSAFPELNVRTYVRVRDRPGVFFFSLDAASLVAVITARTLFHLPYHWASMQVSQSHGEIAFSSQRRQAVDRTGVDVTYAPVGEAFQPSPGTLEHFLSERYCFYTGSRDTTSSCRLLTCDVHHPPWSLQRADAAFRLNTIAQASGLALSSSPPLLHFSRRQDVVAWRPRLVAP